MLWFLSLFACSGSSHTVDSQCQKALNDICILTSDCTGTAKADCDENIGETYVCNRDADIIPQSYDACIGELETAINAQPSPDCTTLFPTDCGGVICSAGDLGCGGGTPHDTAPEQTIPPPHTGQPTGHTGATN